MDSPAPPSGLAKEALLFVKTSMFVLLEIPQMPFAHKAVALCLYPLSLLLVAKRITTNNQDNYWVKSQQSEKCLSCTGRLEEGIKRLSKWACWNG